VAAIELFSSLVLELARLSEFRGTSRQWGKQFRTGTVRATYLSDRFSRPHAPRRCRLRALSTRSPSISERRLAASDSHGVSAPGGALAAAARACAGESDRNLVPHAPFALGWPSEHDFMSLIILIIILLLLFGGGGGYYGYRSGYYGGRGHSLIWVLVVIVILVLLLGHGGFGSV
jgi:hypothetical protein